MKKRILVNAYFAKNLGDDLFLKVLFDRYPNVEWDLLTSNEEYRKVFCDYYNVKIIKTLNVNIGKRQLNLFYKLNDLFFRYKKYDAYVVIGGSIFLELPHWKEHLIGRGYLPNIFRELNKKTFLLGANFGPFKDKLFIEKHREFFKKFDDICFRDEYSYKIFRDMENVRVAPDVVFNMRIQKNINKNKEKIVGFSLINIEQRKELKEYKNKYSEKIIELVEKYIALGYIIKLFSFCEDEGDQRINNYIVNNINKKNVDYVEIINYEGKIDKFIDEFQSCKVIIGTRFHSIILGFLFNQSVFPIIYSDKTYNVLKDLKMEKNCCYIRDIDKFDANKIIENTKKLKNRGVLLEAEMQFRKLDLFINNEINDYTYHIVSEEV